MENNHLYVTPDIPYPQCSYNCTTTPCGVGGQYTMQIETCIDGPGDTPYTNLYCDC